MQADHVVKVIHSGDLHLGGQRSGLTDRDFHAQRFAVWQDLLDLCEQEQVQILLLAGDFLEQDAITEAELQTVRQQLYSLTQAGVKVFISPGNHDAATPLSSYRQAGFWPQGVKIFLEPETCFLADLQCTVSGAGFQSLYQRQGFLPALTDAYREWMDGQVDPAAESFLSLAVLHGEMRHGPGGLYNPITSEQVAKSPFTYLALGHIHQPDYELNRAGQTAFAFCGTPQGVSRKDLGPRGAHLLTFSGNDLIYHRFVPLARTTFQKALWQLNTPTDTAQAVSQIQTQLTQDRSGLTELADHSAGPEHRSVLYDVTLEGTSYEEEDFDLGRLQEALRQEGIATVRLQNNLVPVMDREKLAAEQSLRGLFYRSLTEQMTRVSGSEAEVVEEALKLGLEAFRQDL